jgi:hypothetical protein
MSIGLLQLEQQDIRYADINPNSAKVGKRFSQLISDNYCSSRPNHRVVLDEGKAKMTGVVAAMRKLEPIPKPRYWPSQCHERHFFGVLG